VAVVFDYAAHPLDLVGLQGVLVLNDPLLVALPSDHPAAASSPVEIGKLADVDWIAGTGFGCAESLRTVCGAAGFEPRVVLNSSRYPTTLALVAEGQGIALVPRTALASVDCRVVARELNPSAPNRRIWAVTDPAPHAAGEGFVTSLARAAHCLAPA